MGHPHLRKRKAAFLGGFLFSLSIFRIPGSDRLIANFGEV
jgi:hypothetical protein